MPISKTAGAAMGGRGGQWRRLRLSTSVVAIAMTKGEKRSRCQSSTNSLAPAIKPLLKDSKADSGAGGRFVFVLCRPIHAGIDMTFSQNTCFDPKTLNQIAQLQSMLADPSSHHSIDSSMYVYFERISATPKLRSLGSKVEPQFDDRYGLVQGSLQG
jgi:hypothetical protein